MIADSIPEVVFRRPELTVVRNEPVSGKQPEEDSNAPIEVTDDVPTENVETEATVSATAEPAVETEATDASILTARTPRAKPTADAIEVIETRRKAVAARLTPDIEAAYMASRSGRRIHLEHVTHTVNLNVTTEGLGNIRVSIIALEKFIASYKVSAKAPKVMPAKKLSMTERIQRVEHDRQIVAAGLTSEIRATFNVDHPKDRWMTEYIDRPIPDNAGPNALRGWELAIARLTPLMAVSSTSVNDPSPEVVSESEPVPATAPVDEVEAIEPEAASIAVEDAIASEVEADPQLALKTSTPPEIPDFDRHAEVMAAAPELSVWLPGEMNEVPATNAGDVAIRRFNLFVRVAQARIAQARLFQSMDETIYDRLPGWSDVDSAAVFTAIDWMYRLGDDLDRLERELMLVETGLNLLAEPGE